jgi:RHS repeat-associated protein
MDRKTSLRYVTDGALPGRWRDRLRRAVGSTLSAVVVASSLGVPPLAAATTALPGRAAAVDPPPGGLVASTPNFGWTDGSLSVSHDGAAQYTVPLWTPPGRGDLQPDLSLTYDSRSGNGPLGVGWSLQGLSTVAPCPRTVAQDGAPGGVRHDSTDVYCMGGSRLRPVAGNTGTQQEFRTERETFTRVIAFGGPGEVPDFFRAWTRGGQILTFGQTQASQLRAHQLVAGALNPPTLTRGEIVTAGWALDRIEDRNGNAVTVEYTTSLGSEANLWAAQLRPESISYGPNRQIVFDYGSRTDPEDSFAGGVHVDSSMRLNTITMSAGAAGEEPEVLRRYTLGYRTDISITERSLLTSVTVCDPAACLRPVEFAWSPGSTEFEVFDTPVGRMGSRIVAGDVTGDGRDDLLHLDTCLPDGGCDRNRWSLRRNVGTGEDTFGPHELAGIPRAVADADHRSDVRPIDFDRDGRMDVMAEVNVIEEEGPSHTEYKLYRSDGASYTEYPDLNPGHDSDIETDLPYFADLDGSGVPDFVIPYSFAPVSQRYHYALGTDSGFGPLTNSQLTSPRGAPARVRVMDHDGDGRSSLLVPDGFANPPRYRVFGLDEQGEPELVDETDAGVNIPFPVGSDRRDLHFADVNGDGLADAVYPLSGLRTQLNTGRGFSPMIDGPDGYFIEPTLSDLDSGVRIVDFDNDGRDDVMLLLDDEPAGPGDVQNGIQLYTWRQGGFVRVPIDEGAGTWYDATGMASTQPLDVNGDDVLDLVRIASDNGQEPSHLQILQRVAGKPDLLTGAVVENGPSVEVKYTTMADRDVHEPCQATYPLVCPVRGGTLVAEHRVSNGLGGTNGFSHVYRDARLDVTGSGWLGFAEHEVVEQLTQMRVVTELDNETRIAGEPAVYPFAHLPEVTTTTVRPDGDTEFRRTVTAGRVMRRLDVAGTYTVEQEFSIETEDERPIADPPAPWTNLRTLVTFHDYDEFGNPTSVHTINAGGRSVLETTTYDNDETDWLLGLLRRRTTESCTADNDCTTRVKTFDYFPNGDLQESVVEPDDPDLLLRTTLDYGDFGELVSVTHSDGADRTRTDTFEYDDASQQLYPTAVRNALGHRTEFETHPGLGVTTGITDPNGFETTMRYDRFGRLREIHRADGSFTRVDHVYFGFQFTTVTTSGGSATTVATDSLGRERRHSVKAFDGQTATAFTEYDSRGRVFRKSAHTLPGETPQYTVIGHDHLDRPFLVTSPDGTVVRHEYQGLETHTFDARDTHGYAVANRDGAVESTFEDDPDSDGWLETEFEYGPFGELTRTIAPDGTEESMEYDIRGRRTTHVDPNAGTTTTTYSAFGEIATETDSTDRTATYVYDALGRVERITLPEGVASYTWDTAANGIGRLTNARSPDGVGINHRYDELGRPDRTWWNIEGTNYEFGFEYDGIGRPERLTYPAIPDLDPADRFAVAYVYNEHGYLEQVKDPAADGVAYWTATGRGGDGQLTGERLGNGVATTYEYSPQTGLVGEIEAIGPGTVGTIARVAYDYDANHNVRAREDNHGRWERYGYDELDRLDRWSTLVASAEQVAINASYDYDEVGNLTAETFQRELEPEQQVVYGYGEDGAGPHALTSRNSQRYGYDAAGRQVSGPQRTVEYNSRDLPVSLTWGTHHQVPKQAEFAYDANGSRAVKRDQGQTVVRAGDGLFARYSPAGTGGTEIHNVHSIVADGRVVAQVNRAQAASGGPVTVIRTMYPHADAQGSTVAVTNPAGRRIGGAGTFLGELFYDPWGRRIDANYEPRGHQRNGLPREGYTGHEHDDEFGLINMTGRLYDPEARRFLTTDPFVANPLSSQGSNRYSYVQNNPATATDPSGFFACNLATDCLFASIGEVGGFLKDALAAIGEAIVTAVANLVNDAPPLPSSAYWRGEGNQGQPSLGDNHGSHGVAQQQRDQGAFSHPNGPLAVHYPKIDGQVDMPAGADLANLDPGNFEVGGSGVRLAADVPRAGYANWRAEELAEWGFYRLAEIAEAGHGCAFCHIVKGYDSLAAANAAVDLRHYNQMAAQLVLAGAVLQTVATGGTKGGSAAVPAATPGGPVRKGPRAYSVAFEYELPRKDWGRSPSVHNNRANKALDQALRSDPAFAAGMGQLIPGVGQAVSRVGGRSTPSGWTWHHAHSSAVRGRLGVMQLVPKCQHCSGSPWQFLLHPGGVGGYVEWAIPSGARPRR